VTGIFKANNPYNNFLLFLYALALKLPIFLHPRIPQTEQLDGYLYKVLLDWIKPAGQNFLFIYSFLTFLLLYLQAIGLNSLVNSQRLMQKPNYLVGMSFLLITSLFTEWYSFSSPVIVNSLLILVLAGLCNLNTSSGPKSSLFNLGMIIGVATFFYIPSIAFILLILVGLGITRPFRLPEWLMVFMGLLTPYYFFAAWLFLAGKWDQFKLPGFVLTIPKFHQTGWAIAAVALIIFTILVGLYFIRLNMRRQVVQARKNWNLIFLYLIVAIIVPFLNTSRNFDYWMLAAVPVAVMAGAAFLYPEKKWFSIFVHWSMVLVSIVMGYYLI
jgi:Family of unknown function (DUF6427)